MLYEARLAKLRMLNVEDAYEYSGMWWVRLPTRRSMLLPKCTEVSMLPPAESKMSQPRMML